MSTQKQRVVWNIVVIQKLIQAQLDTNQLPKRLKEAQITGVMCQRGCGHCCRTTQVILTEEECVEIVRVLEAPANMQLRANIIARLNQLPDTANKKNGMPSTPCVFLDGNDECSIYENRPVVCRPIYSQDIQLCRQLDQSGPSAIPNNSFSWIAPLKQYCFNGLQQGCRQGSFVYEINSIMRHIFLNNPVAYRQGWVAGRQSHVLSLKKGQVL